MEDNGDPEVCRVPSIPGPPNESGVPGSLASSEAFDPGSPSGRDGSTIGWSVAATIYPESYVVPDLPDYPDGSADLDDLGPPEAPGDPSSPTPGSAWQDWGDPNGSCQVGEATVPSNSRRLSGLLRLQSSDLGLGEPPPDARVLTAAKYAKGWALVNNLFPPQRGQDLLVAAEALRDGLEDVSRVLEAVLFDESLWIPPSGIAGPDNRDTGNMRRPGAHGPHRLWGHMEDGSDPNVHIAYSAPRETILAALRDVQAGPARRMSALVDELSGAMYNVLLLGEGGAEAISGIVPRPANQVVQPMPDDLRVPMPKGVLPVDELSPDTVAVLRNVADAISAATRMTRDHLGDSLLAWADSDAAIPGLDIEDFGLISRLTTMFQKGRRTSPLLYLYAAMVPLWSQFASSMKRVFAGRGELTIASLKRYGRAAVKVAPGGDYDGESEPLAQHIKDLLRCSLVVGTPSEMAEAYHELEAAHQVVSCKNRVAEAPVHDVLAIIRLEGGYLAEVQFHFRSITVLKSFGHAAYSVLRTDAEHNSCYGLISLFDITWFGQADLKNADKAKATATTLVLS